MPIRHSSPLSCCAKDDSLRSEFDAFPRRGLVLAGLGLLALATSGARGAETCLSMTYAPSSAVVGVGAYGIVSADLDADGDVDVLIPEGNSNAIRRLTNLGNGSFATTMIAVGGAPASLGLGDVDHDGDSDVLVAMATSMRLLLNNGSGSFSLGPVQSFPNNGSSPAAAFLRDMNSDGNADAVIVLDYLSVGASASGGLLVALGNGSGGLAMLPAHLLQVQAGRGELADLNGDGRLDLAVLGGSVSWNTISLSFGNGDGTFTNSPTLYSAGLYAGAFGSGDLDGDGDVDLLRGNKYSLSVLLNDGAGGFTNGASMSIGSYGKGVAVGDVDHDGDLDLAATSGGGAAIRILNNDGHGTFTQTHTLAASVQCYAVMLADTSGDGYLDPWAVDVVSGQLFRGSSHCIAARYGQAKVNSLGCLPTMGIIGTPSISSSNFAVTTNHELESQPALLILGLAPTDFTALGGHVLVATPWSFVFTTTSAGSGNPSLCDGALELSIPGTALGLAPIGTKVYVQALAADPFQSDFSMASLSDGLRFEIVP